jgi:enamine deaminase RidA (YjgF/YER057c/UK114 family)
VTRAESSSSYAPLIGFCAAHQEVFAMHPPAATMVVTRLLDARMRIEIEVVAHAAN